MNLREQMAENARLAREKTEEAKLEAKENNNGTKTDGANVDDPKEGITDNNKPDIFDFESHQDEMFGFLSDKAGREIKSFDDLLEVKEVEKVNEVRKYSSKEAEAYDKYFEETNRPMNDFIKCSRDIDSIKDEDAILDYLEAENSFLNRDQIKLKYKSVFSTPEPLDPEEYEAEDVAMRAEEIQLAEIERLELAAKAKKALQDAKEKYYTPLENAQKQREDEIKAGQERWTTGMNEALNNIGEITIGDVQYKVKDVEKYRESLSTAEGVMNIFKNEDGKFDFEKLAKTLVIQDNMKSILDIKAKTVKSDTIKEQMKDKSNFTEKGVKKDAESSDGADKAKQDLLNHIKGIRR